ncbi:MAG TPA: hypothetical protein PK024_05575 [Methanospirillum sp.]|uniref:hypothetical protein n=1 Tax=Methanospirillum sp. TaxID=45200 RepID=UPI002CBECD43|nr:hypothetical protein [Methanospirillum sp.]HOJ96293.1 hypothetical protein [Methanospirillum sp.]
MIDEDKHPKKEHLKLTGESDLTIEVVILLIFGIFMLIFGFLLFQIHTGVLPYAPDSTYGLFVLLMAFQIITMGKTPFGDLKRSWLLVLVGIIVGILGMAAAFVPGYLSDPVRLIVGGGLLFGGIALFLQLFIREDKAWTWRKVSGVLQHLILACGLIYIIACICGLITLFPGITTDQQTAVILILFALSFFYLAYCVQKVRREIPLSHQEGMKSGTDQKQMNGVWQLLEETSLSLSLSILLMVAVLLTLLGIILILVNLGMIAFSQDGLLGMLLVIFSIQMMALGETPLGAFKRTWIMTIFGMIFATLGVVSCIVPGLLTGLLQILLGLLNILGGVILLTGRFLPVLAAMKNPPAAPVPQFPILKKLNITLTILNLVSIAFGISMLMPGIMPGMLNAEIIVINGLLLFVLAYIVHTIDKISADLSNQPSVTE